MKTLLVTGGCGFIGSNFIRSALASDDFKVLNLDKLTYAGNSDNLTDFENNPNYSFFHGDIGDKALVSKLFQENAIDAVINFAAESHVDRSIDSPEVFFQTNVLSTLSLVETTLAFWKKNKSPFKFIHVSTDEVYGSLGPLDSPFSESSPYRPNSPYAASKASSDFIVRSFIRTYGFPAVITNCSNNYGPYQFPEKLIPLALQKALAHEPIPIYGNGQNVRDWLFVEDHCDALLKVLDHGQLGQTYNIGGCCEVTNLQLIQALCALLDKRLSLPVNLKSFAELITFVDDRPGHDSRYAIDISKIKKSLDWQPRTSLDEGLAKTIDWYLSHPDWTQKILKEKYNLQRLGSQ